MTLERGSSRQPGFRPDAALARRLGSYSLLAGAALAQASTALASDGVPGGTPADLPYTFPPDPGGNKVNGVTNEFDLDVDANGTTDFSFMTFYANVFNPVIGSSWTTIQVYIKPAAGNAVLAHKSKQPAVSYQITSRACNSAMISSSPSGPGIEGGKDFTNSTNYLLFWRKVRTSCSACTNNTYRTMLYDDGKWSDRQGGGAVPFQLTSGGTTQYGWINVSIPGGTAEATLQSAVLGPGTVTGTTDNSDCLADNAALEPDPAMTPIPDRMLALPLPDGSVPMSLGLLATGAAGNQLWRAAQTRVAELPGAR
jgi:hypothetical protein